MRARGAGTDKMMRVLAFAALVGAVKAAGLTSDGLACADSTRAATETVSALCEIKAVSDKVAAEVAALTTPATSCLSTGAACPCWGCMASTVARTDVFETMAADNDAVETALAAELTVMTPATFAACAEDCGLGAANGPVVITEQGFELDSSTVLPATGNWCGEWSARQTTETCKTSIFDAKGLLFLIIIGGALSIIFFQCSIMAVVAAMSAKKGAGDAKP